MAKIDEQLLESCADGNIQECTNLLAKGAKPNFISESGQNAFNSTSKIRNQKREAEMLKLLIENGLDISGKERHPTIIKALGGPKLSDEDRQLQEKWSTHIDQWSDAGFMFNYLSEEAETLLREFQLPEDVIRFYRFAYPMGSQNSDLEFFSPAMFKYESTAYTCEGLFPVGIIPIAVNCGGEPHCIDTRQFKSLEESPIYWFYVSGYDGDYDRIIKEGKIYAKSFIEMLDKVAKGEMY